MSNTPQPITLKPATKQDLPTILAFIKDLAEYEKLSHQVIATEETLEKSLFGDRQIAEVIFAEIDGQKVGFCLFFHNFSTFLGKPGIYVEDLFVQPAFRGRGIGRAFFGYLAALAQERGCGRLELWCLDWNQKSIDFYESLGATAMHEWTVFRWTEDKIAQLRDL